MIFISPFLLSSLFLSFFFLMIRRPPRSTLFPSRRSSDLEDEGHAPPRLPQMPAYHLKRADGSGITMVNIRSEEHTSELQSRRDLVCRLLLEKKKKKKTKLIQLNIQNRI